MKLSDGLQAANQLGWDQAFYNFFYRLNIRLGTYKFADERVTPKNAIVDLALFTPAAPETIKKVVGDEGLSALVANADRITEGEFLRFGDTWMPIDLDPPANHIHWSDIERSLSTYIGDLDIKQIWEPSRFGWAIILARAYHLTKEKKYVDGFVAKFYEFIERNPVNHGPNWLSGQEVGIRMISVLIAARLFEADLPSGFDTELGKFIYQHACRVQRSLTYARSQNNNHYLTESIALLTASKALPGSRPARKWRRKAIKGIRWCYNNQFHATGEYVQHSTNYHRLMTQALVWAMVVEPEILNWVETENFSNASAWYAARVDPHSGGMPNLGANDGALLFPLDQLSFSDHRGTLSLAQTVLRTPEARKGPWDEGALWLSPGTSSFQITEIDDPAIIKNDRSWGSLRFITHQDRPSHADHLHFDLWWKGYNLLIDPGTYSYNLPAPWDNALTSAEHHNTVTINGMDQMRKISKFLYLDWGNSWIKDVTKDTVTAETDVWRVLGIQHEREIRVISTSEWVIYDTLTSEIPNSNAHVELRWHFPDLPWTIMEDDQVTALRLRAPVGKPTIEISCSGVSTGMKLVRAGELLHGSLPVKQTEGWTSPTYLRKDPALSLTFSAQLNQKLTFTSRVMLDEV